jgi:2-amino-4-hydroxy-6-hydroxymethyldihydropteridine diphosphokinase
VWKLSVGKKMHEVFFSIGSNLGCREQNLGQVIDCFNTDLKILVKGVSSVYETSPVGKTDQPDFLNAVISGLTRLTPPELLDYVKDIEKIMGREETERWGPRIIDIDILLYEGVVMQTEKLTVPHAEMKNRAFVLIPLAEIAPGLVFPDGTSVEENLKNLPEKDKVFLRKDIFLT